MKKIKNSKKGVLLFIVCVVHGFVSVCGYAQNNTSKQQIVDTLNKFYIVYNTEWATDTGFTLQRKIYALRERYCTVKLLKKIGNDLDNDPLIKNIGTDIEYLKTLTIRKDSTKLDTYIVSFIAHGYDFPNKKGEFKIPEIIHIKVVNEKGAIKIDSAW
ncbi:MAG TPA: hypothetical protein VKR58_13500 [Aquella sp.]|nr:hypothetical protein [Aquella sp.]